MVCTLRLGGRREVASFSSCGSVMTFLHTGVGCCFLRWRGWYSLVTGILLLAKKSLSNEVMIFMCMSSKADKPCNSKHVVKVSFVRP